MLVGGTEASRCKNYWRQKYFISLIDAGHSLHRNVVWRRALPTKQGLIKIVLLAPTPLILSAARRYSDGRRTDGLPGWRTGLIVCSDFVVLTCRYYMAKGFPHLPGYSRRSLRNAQTNRYSHFILGWDIYWLLFLMSSPMQCSLELRQQYNHCLNFHLGRYRPDRFLGLILGSKCASHTYVWMRSTGPWHFNTCTMMQQCHS